MMFLDKLSKKTYMLMEEDGGGASLIADGDVSGGGNGETGAGGETENSPPKWMDMVPAKFKDSEALRKHESVDSFFEASQNAFDRLAEFEDKQTIVLPGENATAEERAELRKLFGVPDEAKGYELKTPELPEGMTMDEGFQDLFKQWAFKAGMSPQMAQIVSDEYNNHKIAEFNQSLNDAEKKLNESTEALRKEWGEGYKEKIEKAKRAFSHFGGEDFTELVGNLGLDQHPVMLRVFAGIGQAMSEDSALGGGFGSGGKEAPKGIDGKTRFTYETDKK
jgi:hypothetical protein